MGLDRLSFVNDSAPKKPLEGLGIVWERIVPTYLLGISYAGFHSLKSLTIYGLDFERNVLNR